MLIGVMSDKWTESENEPHINEPQYLYHRQDPQSQKRHIRRRKKKEVSREPVTDLRLAQRRFIANVWNFLIVAAIMVMIMGLAFVFLKKNWNSKLKSHIHRNTSTTQVSKRKKPIHFTPLAPSKVKYEHYIFNKDAFERYFKIREDHSPLFIDWTIAGNVFFSSQYYEDAIPALELASVNDNYSPTIYHLLGRAYLERKQINQAIRAFTIAIENDPDLAENYYYLSMCYELKRNSPRAWQLITTYLELNPNDPKALKEQALLVAKTGRYNETLDILDKAIELDPSWSTLYFEAAAAAALLGKNARAANYLEQAIPHENPIVIYKVYKQNVFRELHLSEEGHLLELQLGDEIRKQMQNQ